MERGNELRPWGIALDRLREERGLTVTELCYRARMGPPQYRVICYKLIDGPSVQTIERLLKALDCTWSDWGSTYDAVSSGLSSQHRALELNAAVGDRLSRAPNESRKTLDPRGTPPHRTHRGTTKKHP